MKAKKFEGKSRDVLGHIQSTKIEVLAILKNIKVVQDLTK